MMSGDASSQLQCDNHSHILIVIINTVSSPKHLAVNEAGGVWHIQVSTKPSCSGKQLQHMITLKFRSMHAVPSAGSISYYYQHLAPTCKMLLRTMHPAKLLK